MNTDIFFVLIISHALADFPLQGNFLAKFKNRHQKSDIPMLWLYCLSMHTLIHGACVWAITGSPTLAVVEILSHAWIDFGKCEKWYGFYFDQFLHLSMKLLYAVVIY